MSCIIFQSQFRVSQIFLFRKKVNPTVKWSDVVLQFQFAYADIRANTKDGST
jgi:hypothetical protein